MSPLVLLVGWMLMTSGLHAQIPDAFPNLASFYRPIGITHAGDGSGRLFLVEQTGRIWVFEDREDVSTRTVFLDLSDRVFEAQSEGGLYSIAFPEDYAEKGYFAVNYVAGSPIDPNGTRRVVVSLFRVSDSDPNVADPASETVLLEVGQPLYNHNGGNILFGPDGYLYIPLGDGGLHPSFEFNGQDRSTPLGSILRIDVEHPGEGRNYSIPSDNPFVGNGEGWLEETWAWGFRNPWRSSFDVEGRLWVGDVGQYTWEEVDIVEGGRNYGWSEFEATHCYTPPCDSAGMVFPVFEYQHGPEQGYSITGGSVYRGERAPQLVGRYVYGDFTTGKVWAIDVTDLANPVNDYIGEVSYLSSFGENEGGDIYALGFFTGRVYDIVTAAISIANEPEASAAVRPLLGELAPNPFRGATTVSVTPGPVRVVLYDVLGRMVSVVFEGVLTSGAERTVRVDGSRLPPGPYLLQAEAPGQRMSRRLIQID